MANLITNKHKKLDYDKKPGGFLKKLSSRKLRRQASKDIEESPPRRRARPTKHSDRKRSGNCPICLRRLARIARRTRFARCCHHCFAQLAPDVKCGTCGTFRVWRGHSESRCKGCGNVVPQ